MQAIDRRELFGDGVGRRVVVLRRIRNPGEHLAAPRTSECLEIVLAKRAPPGSAHGISQRRVVQQRRRPFGRVNFHDQGGVDQPGLLEQPFAVLVGIFGAQPVDDRIVLPVEQRVHDRETDPPVAVHSGKLELGIRIIGGLGIERQVVGLGHMQLAVRQQPRRPSAHAVLHLEIGTVDLRAVPPLGDDVAEGRRASCVRRSCDRVQAGAQDGHFRLRPIVARRNRKAMWRAILVVEPVAQPIVHHELQPRPQQDIDRRRRNELAARQQLATDDARVGLVEFGRILAEGLRKWRVAAEARFGHTHPRLR